MGTRAQTSITILLVKKIESTAVCIPIRPFSTEIDNIFHRGWVYVGHANEIPARATRVTTIGQSVIMVRDEWADTTADESLYSSRQRRPVRSNVVTLTIPVPIMAGHTVTTATAGVTIRIAMALVP
jgi:hypothetical protein